VVAAAKICVSGRGGAPQKAWQRLMAKAIGNNGHGGKRRNSGRPLGARNLRPYGAIVEAEHAYAGLVPTQFEGDSLEFLRATMQGKIWPTREQIYAAKSVLPIEHPPAVAIDGRSVEEVREQVRKELQENQEHDRGESIDKLMDDIGRLRRATIRRHDEQLRGWIAAGLISADFGPQIRAIYADVAGGDEPFDPCGPEAHISEIRLPVPVRPTHEAR